MNNSNNNNNRRNTHLNDSSTHRRQQKKQKTFAGVIVLCVFAIAVLLVYFNWGTITAPFEGIARPNRGSGEVGFPVRLPGSASYNLNQFDTGFMVLTETYIYTYNSDGSSNYEYQHGYGTPKASVSGKRILVYDENGRQFSLFGKNGRIYEKSSDERIVYGKVGENERTAIVYRGASHANVLEIYDGNGEWRYRKRFSDENIMQVDFASSDNDIVVTSIGFRGGDMTAFVRRYDTLSEEEDGIWEAELPKNIMPLSVYVKGGNVFVLCNSAFFVLNSNSGDLIGSYEYRGTLIDFAFLDNAAALLVDDYTAGNLNIISLDETAELIGITETPTGTLQLELHGRSIVALRSDVLVKYEHDLKEYEELELREEYSRFIYVDNEILLLGYNAVNRLSYVPTEEIQQEEPE
jgi:hypothetical protein